MQTWALQYWLWLDRRQLLEDKVDEMELQCSYLAPDRWRQIKQFSDASYADRGQAFGGEEEIPVTDPGEVRDFYSNLGETRVMNGGQIPVQQDSMGALFGLVDGPGRRV